MAIQLCKWNNNVIKSTRGELDNRTGWGRNERQFTKLNNASRPGKRSRRGAVDGRAAWRAVMLTMEPCLPSFFRPHWISRVWHRGFFIWTVSYKYCELFLELNPHASKTVTASAKHLPSFILHLWYQKKTKHFIVCLMPCVYHMFNWFFNGHINHICDVFRRKYCAGNWASFNFNSLLSWIEEYKVNVQGLYLKTQRFIRAWHVCQKWIRSYMYQLFGCCILGNNQEENNAVDK